MCIDIILHNKICLEYDILVKDVIKYRKNYHNHILNELEMYYNLLKNNDLYLCIKHYDKISSLYIFCNVGNPFLVKIDLSSDEKDIKTFDDINTIINHLYIIYLYDKLISKEDVYNCCVLYNIDRNVALTMYIDLEICNDLSICDKINDFKAYDNTLHPDIFYSILKFYLYN